MSSDKIAVKVAIFDVSFDFSQFWHSRSVPPILSSTYRSRGMITFAALVSRCQADWRVCIGSKFAHSQLYALFSLPDSPLFFCHFLPPTSVIFYPFNIDSQLTLEIVRQLAAAERERADDAKREESKFFPPSYFFLLRRVHTIQTLSFSSHFLLLSLPAVSPSVQRAVPFSSTAQKPVGRRKKSRREGE